MKLKLISALVLCALTSACTNSAPPVAREGFIQMTGPEIQTALIGNSLDGSDSDGDYVIYYPNAQQMRIAYLGQTDVGTWRVDGDRYCRRWTKFGNGKERCVRFFRNGAQIDWVRKGKITDKSILVPGNPASL